MKQCYYCGGELVEQLTTFVYETNGQFQIVRNVPAFVCSRCGEKEYTQEVTREILEFLRHPSTPVEILNIPAYDLEPAEA
jgi:YgiT-type zinc finger domain-containing protein